MMIEISKQNVPYLNFQSFLDMPFVYHAFSTKRGGVSTDIFESMNLSFGRGDSDNNVIRNFEILCNALQIDIKTLVFSSQTHTSNILTVTKADCGKGIFYLRTWEDMDGLVTCDENVTLITHYADCVPLFFTDKVKKIVGVAHAGWKGTVLGISSCMIKKMKTEFGADAKDIIVGIGPSIGKCCFEVDEKTANEFYKLPDYMIKDAINKRHDFNDPMITKYDINLQKVNMQQLLAEGVLPENIEDADICTKCNSDYLFSHRATAGNRGGMVALIGLHNIDKTKNTLNDKNDKNNLQ